MKTLNTLLKIVSFGQLKNFMEMTTTIGYTVYTPTKWEALSEETKEEVLRHERVHMRQKARYGFWFYLLYLALPVPILFAYFRTKFEQEAYAESMRFIARKHGVAVICTEKYKEWMIGNFTGSSYLWAWVLRRQVETWYLTTTALIRIELEGIGH